MSSPKSRGNRRDSSDSDSDDDGKRINGFRTAADTLTLSASFLSSAPKNIREWSSTDTQGWLADLFSGAEDLPKYSAEFGKFGIRGIDLLSANDQLLNSLGIVHAIHLNRATTSIAQMIVYQQAIDKQLKKEQKLRQKEKPYYELLDQANALKSNLPPYQLPRGIMYWKAVDVMLWLETPENQATLSMFIKPFAFEKIGGRELLEIIEKPELFNDICRSLKQPLTPVDINRLTEAVKNKVKYFDELNKKIRESKNKEMEQALAKIKNQREITNLAVIGEGNFGRVYSAIYKNQKVALKTLKLTSAKNDNQKSLQDDKDNKKENKGESKDDAKSNDDPEEAKKKKEGEEKQKLKEQEFAEALLREAYVMSKCSGKGIVRVFGHGKSKSGAIFIAMEFMSGRSVEDELRRSLEDDGSDSIFHDQHKENLSLQSRQGVDNPVFYQILRIGRDVASALSRIHSLGVIHLDIAARNILLDENKRPKITDFGLAQFEAEMIEQSQYRAGLIEETKTKNMDKVERDHYIQWNHDKEGAPVDKFEHDNKLKIFEGQRPIPLMPIWTLVDKQIIDRHWDIYAFGCFLYEMTMKHPPFHDAADQADIILRKQSLATHPQFPPEIDGSFCTVVRKCWDAYEKQPSLDEVHEEITKLHKAVSAQSNTLTVLEAYNNIKETLSRHKQNPTTGYSAVAAYANPITGTGSTSQGYSTVGYSSPPSMFSSQPQYSPYLQPPTSFQGQSMYSSNLTYSVPGASLAAAENTPLPMVSTPSLLAKFLIPRRVRLTVDPSDLDGPKDADKEELEAILECAMRSQDYITIVDIMEKIPLSNDSDQLDIVQKCLELLGNFASDCHTTSDEDSVWRFICERLLGRLDRANRPLVDGSMLDGDSLLRVTKSTMIAIGCFVKGKHFSSNDDDNISQKPTDPLQLALLMAAFGNLKKYSDCAEIVAQCGKILFHVINDSDELRNKLSREGGILLLMEAIDRHSGNMEVVEHCFVALGGFYLHQLLCPASAQPVQGNTRQLQVQDPNIVIQGWTRLARCFFDVLKSYLAKVPMSLLVANIAQSSSTNITETNSSQNIIEKIVSVMLETCDKAKTDVVELEKTFHAIEAEDIETLLRMISLFPDNFTLQEGGMGLLAFTLQTGNEAPIVRLAHCPQVDAVFTLSSARRLEIFLASEAPLKAVLAGMEKFAVDDKIAIGIRRDKLLDANKQQKAYYSSGLYFSGTSQGKSASSSGHYGTTTGKYSSTRDSNSYRNYGSNNGMTSPPKSTGEKLDLKDDFLEDFQKSALHFDEDGKHISAARLQRSAATIIGISSMNNKEVQIRLYRTRYNELILQAFKNFRQDVDLIHFGFIALYFTCRKNAMHQVFLHELSITKHLFAALNRFRDEDFGNALRLIMEGVVGGLVGLLEPEEDKSFSVNNLDRNTALWLEKEASRISVDKNAHKYCKELADYLSREDTKKYTELEKLAIYLIGFLDDEEAHSIFVMFFKLLSTILFWNPEVLGRWKNLFLLLSKDTTLNLFQYVSLILNRQQHMNVLASGLSLLTAFGRQLCGDNVLFGEEISYLTVTINGETTDAGQDQLLGYCLIACKHQLFHSILVRYSLWLMIYLIAGKENSDNSSKVQVKLDSNRDAAAEIALENGVEWAIEVLKHFTEYYSIQALAISFLIWMERRGHFAKRQERLKELKTILQDIAAAAKEAKYLTLDEEGHDTSLIGRSIYMFGDVLAHADRLIRLIDSHIVEKVQINHNSWDGVTRPLRIEGASFAREEDSASGRNVNVFVINVVWETIVDPSTNLAKDIQWTITKRYASYAKLQQDLQSQFSCLPPLFSSRAVIPKFGRVVKLLGDRSPEFLDNRRKLLNQGFQDLYKVRAALFSPALLHFIEADKHVSDLRSPSLQSSIPIENAEFPVTALLIDEKEMLLFVGTGIPASMLHLSNALRGKVIVYRFIVANGEFQLQKTTSLSFSAGVNRVAWDPLRRCLSVGLTVGVIGYYALSSDATTLTAAGEFDFHTDSIINLQFILIEKRSAVEYEKTLIGLAASISSKATIVDMSTAKVVSQLASSNARFASIAFDVVDMRLIVGSDSGSVRVYDMSTTTPKLLTDLSLNHAQSQQPNDEGLKLNSKGPVFVEFSQDQRLVYAAHHNKVFVYRMPISSISAVANGELRSGVHWKCLVLADRMEITSLKLLHYGKLVIVNAAGGASVIFDLSEKPISTDRMSSMNLSRSSFSNDPAKPVLLMGSHEASAKINNEFTTTASSLVSWQELVKGKETALRDWLRGKGEVASDITTRAGLMQAVATKAGVNVEALANAITPKNPFCDALFAFHFHSKKPKVKHLMIRTVVMFEQTQTLLLGGDDGYIHRYSLMSYYPPYHGTDINELQANYGSDGKLHNILGTTKTSKMKKYAL